MAAAKRQVAEKRNFKWSGEKLARLRRLVDLKLNDYQIADRMGETVAAVRGARVKYIGPSEIRGRPPEPNTSRKRPPRALSIQQPVQPSRRFGAKVPDAETAAFIARMLARFDTGYGGQEGTVTLIDLEPHHCRYPIDGRYCGAVRREESSYCREHHRRCFNEEGKEHG